MSVQTFDGARAPNVKNIRKTLAGAVFVKRWTSVDAPITKVYTTAGASSSPPGTPTWVCCPRPALRSSRVTPTRPTWSRGAMHSRRTATSPAT